MTIFFLQKERAVFKKTDSLEPQARKYRSSDAVGDMSYEEWQESRIEKTRDIEYQTRVGEAIRQGYMNEYKAVRESAVDNRGESGIIQVTRNVSGHSPTPKSAEPYAVIDHLDDGGKTETRTFFGDDGMKQKDITNHDHGNPKWHDFGEHGEHAHDYTWDENGELLLEKTTSELTDDERKANGDML